MPRDCRIYVGNLPSDVRSRDIDDLFGKYGKIVDVDLKNRKSPPFAFVEFDDPRDAEDAVDGRDGYDFDGYRLRVEFPRGAGPRGPGGRLLREDRGGGRGSRAGPPARSKYRVEVSGLPKSGSWQDLKDHMKKAGEVCYADVFRDGTGIVEFECRDDMEYAIKKLDDTKFRSHKGDSAYIRVREAGGSGSRRSRSRSRSRRRDSPRYSRSRSHSRSRSPPKKTGDSKKRSVSRSRSRNVDRSPFKSRSPSPSRNGGQKRRSPTGSRSPSPAPKKTRSQSRSRSRSRTPRSASASKSPSLDNSRSPSRSRSRSSNADSRSPSPSN